jgi:alkylmercury lyase
MTRPLLPAIDAAGQLREVGFALLVSRHYPIEVVELAEAAGLGLDAAHRAVDSLAASGWLDLDDEGRVSGAAGFSLSTGPHNLLLDNSPFRTWCAYDALGIPAALRADAAVRTTCGQCDAPISLGFRAGIPDRSGPERLWLGEGGADLRGSFCSPTVLLCGDEHGAMWSDAQGGRGELLDLTEGAWRGAADWARCAIAAARFS